MRTHFLRVALAAAFLLSLVSVAPAQTKPATGAAEPFEPRVGQSGKDVVWVPSPQALVDRMLDMAKLTPKDFHMDLGSGDGITVISAARRGATSMGIEYEPQMVELSRKNAQAAGVADKATFVKADLFETDLGKADVITMFLLPSINMRLRPKILDLKPGTRIVSNTFDMEDWEADETQNAGGDCTSWCTALLWIVPAKVQGTWQTPQGELVLTQTFQKVSGTLAGAAVSGR
ncbi:MAG: cyclopropane-fatty-acyl-phospholipid synthase family protein, partial [Vicinamibacterales bacterium]